MSTTTRSFILTLVGATFFMGSSFIASKILLRDFSPFLLVGCRFILAALATLPILFFQKTTLQGLKISKNVRNAFIVGLLQTTGTMGLLFVSMTYISATNSAVLLFTNPIWVAIVAPYFLGETVQRVQWLGLLLGILGVGLIIGFTADNENSIGYLIGLGSAFCWSSATIFAKLKKIELPPFVLSATQMLFGGIVLVGIGLALGEHLPSNLTTTHLAWFLWLAIPASTGSFGLWYLALSKGGAMRASSFLFLAPFFTAILSFLILHTTLSGVQLVGALSVGLGIYLSNLDRK
ncbi:MAG: hypothetical protein RLZZ292_2767 [Bacteroidota bacterium]|jgi:drug/metabolite transporter (DMT)-like permease